MAPPPQHPNLQGSGQQAYNGPTAASSSGPQQPPFALPNSGGHPQPQVARQVPVSRAPSFSAPSQPNSPYSAASPGYNPGSPNVASPTNAPSPSYQNLAPSQQSHAQPHAQQSYAPQPQQSHSGYTQQSQQSHVQPHQQQQHAPQPQHAQQYVQQTHSGYIPQTQAHVQQSQPQQHQQPHFAPQIVNRNPPPNPNVTNNYRTNSYTSYNTGTAASSPMSTPNTAPNTAGQQSQPQYSTAAFAPAAAANGPSTPGAMGPPTGRPQREYEYDVTDSLMGTGVNIRDEENALADYYAGSYGQDARAGAPAVDVGSGFSGGGFANQPGVDPGNLSQKEFEAKAAERTWNDSAHRLAASKSSERENSFLDYSNLHALMDKIAKTHGLELNLDNKNNPQQAHNQRSRPVAEWPVPTVSVKTVTTPDGATVVTNGSFVPADAFLADQLALVSLATKERLRGLLQKCDESATHRQQSSHGVIPMAWSDDGLNMGDYGICEDEEMGGSENGEPAGDGFRRRKRPLPTLSKYLRDVARQEREDEDERIRKRQKRQADEAAAATGSRASTNATATPGMSAPDPDKAISKKEAKKINAAQKHDASAESVNSTTAKFLGGSKKKYSWMTGGASAPRAPARAAGGGGTPAFAPSPKPAVPSRPTPEGRSQQMGVWRESSERGKNIQIRDWITALERDGRVDPITMYKTYDMQEPRRG